MDTERTEPMSGRWLKDLPAALTAATLIAGAMVYGLLATAYDEFYAELGLTPSDVGIAYGQALGGAAALSVVVVLLMAGLTLAFWLAARRLRRRMTIRRAWVCLTAAVGLSFVVALLGGGMAGLVFLAGSVSLFANVHPKVSASVGTGTFAGVCGAGLSFLALSVLVGLYANSVADRVKQGEWVEPPDAGGMVFFSVRAMPAEVLAESATGPDRELVQEVRDHRTLFLGQANGLLVVYDADTQESLLLPSAKFRVQVLNCETSRLEAERGCE